MRAHGRQAGAALLLVLWVVVLLTGVVTLFATAARTEGMQGRTLSRATAARYAAEAGLEVAALHLQGADLRTRWLPDGRPQRFVFDGHRLEVRVVDESAKVDLNAAPADVLSGLLLALQVAPDRARALAGAIIDWRDTDNLLSPEGGAEDGEYASAGLPYGAKDRPFETLSELRLVLGMDPALFEKMRPYVTLYSGLARPNPAYAGKPVLQALGLNEDQVAQMVGQREGAATGPAGPVAAQGSGTYSISSRATRPDGTRVQVQAAIRIGGGTGFGQLYLPL